MPVRTFFDVLISFTWKCLPKRNAVLPQQASCLADGIRDFASRRPKDGRCLDFFCYKFLSALYQSKFAGRRSTIDVGNDEELTPSRGK